MIENFKTGEWVEHVSYEVRFYYDAGGGFAFPCDENGKLFINENTNPAAIKNYHWCLKNEDKFDYCFNHVVKQTHSWHEPNSGICHCGQKMELVNEYMGACECPKCGQWYNLFGQELKSPMAWSNGDDW
mgnify:CR=1 FL=1